MRVCHPGGVGDDLVRDIRQALQAAADPAKAPGMQAYMKSELPFLGVQRQAMTRALKPVLGREVTREEWLAAATLLWDDAHYREERYAALALLRARPWLSADDEPLLRHLVSTGAWWDLVDETATKLLGPLRDSVDVRAWAVADDMWMRRAAIICQVGRRADTDSRMLSDVIEANLEDRRFWITKAIGWALRDYAYAAPDWVRSFVAEHDLAPLSRREAMKHLR